MLVETKDAFYDFEINKLQIEITGICNLKCKHCRASYDPMEHISIDLVDKLFDFLGNKKPTDLIISGGEPFLHPKIVDILKLVKSKNVNNLIITTSGFHLKEKIIKEIKSIGFNNITFQISIDSAIEEKHNAFRGHHKSFKNALSSIEMLNRHGFFVSTRTTLTPNTLDEKDNIIDLVTSFGARRVSFGTVVPSGKAQGCGNSELFVSSIQKKEHFDMFFKLKRKYLGKIEIETEDPLKFSHPEASLFWEDDEVEFSKSSCYISGCDAGIGQINMYSNGDITPCALFNKVLFNLKDISVEEARKKYSDSDLIQTMLVRDFTATCKKCSSFRNCGGGCRAIPYGISGNYRGYDSTCFKNCIPVNNV